MSCLLYLLRHGATAANRETPYRLQGRHLDLELDDTGRRQAQQAARALRSTGLSAVYCSPLLRARETAAAIARPHDLSPIEESGLTEADIGQWEGKTWAEVEAEHPELYREFLRHPGLVRYLDGESFLDVQRRVTPLLAELAQRHEGESIAVVSHNIVNRAVLAGLIGLPINAARSIRQSNGGISLIEYGGHRPSVIMLNSCLHLGGDWG